jgi:aminoglycoside phosphotransferase (APT) family kinase protein
MSRRRPRRILDQSLDDHPAVLAWQAVEPEAQVPECIEVFSESPNWLLYALRGAGPDGSTVFAKRRLASTATTERAVYERLLPSLPVATPRYFGCAEDGAYVWLLLQGIDGAPYDEGDPEHRATAGGWVATMHTAAVTLVHSASLPGAGPERYLAHLVQGRETLRRYLNTSRALDPGGQEIIDRTIDTLNRVETCWPVIRARCQGAPITLVHADFRPKNVFVRSDGTGFVAFDWETAGWGPPAADLTKIDVTAYWEAARLSWNTLSLETVHDWARIGHLFQLLAAIDWKGTELGVDTAEALATPLVSLDLMGTRLADVSASL